MELQVNDALQRELRKGEALLWAGRPRRRIWLRAVDTLLIPFSILWCGFVVLFLLKSAGLGAPPIFLGVGVLFLMLGLYLLFGRFLVDAAIRRRTFYGLTNERLIIVSGLFSQSVRSHMLCSMPEIGLTEHSDGTGTIDFSRSDSIWGFIGMYTSNPWQGVSTYKFERIADARELYSKILDLRRPTST